MRWFPSHNNRRGRRVVSSERSISGEHSISGERSVSGTRRSFDGHRSSGRHRLFDGHGASGGRKSSGQRGPLGRHGFANGLRTTIAAATVLVLVLVTCAWTAIRANAQFAQAPPRYASTDQNPFAGAGLYVYPDSQAARAYRSASSSQQSQLSVLASTPTAIWLTLDHVPASAVEPYLHGILADAQRARQTAVFVVYGFPNRDCGNYSGNGILADEYLEWVQAITIALRQSASAPILILEPDALALSTQCRPIAANLPLLRIAVDWLSTSGASIYIDAGHSAWVPARQMASLLQRVGLGKVRGFSLNVSNYNSDADEQRYGDAINQLTGSHYIIDSGRASARLQGQRHTAARTHSCGSNRPGNPTARATADLLRARGGMSARWAWYSA
jgi:endoglucanase